MDEPRRRQGGWPADLANTGLMTVFESILVNPVTNKRLAELLKKAAQGDTAPPEEAPSPFQSVYTAGQTRKY